MKTTVSTKHSDGIKGDHQSSEDSQKGVLLDITDNLSWVSVVQEDRVFHMYLGESEYNSGCCVESFDTLWHTVLSKGTVVVITQ